MSLESRDVPVTTDRTADNVEAVGQPLRSPARHPIPIADSFVFQHARSSYGLSPSSFRNLKERSFKNLVKQTGGGRERSASCGNYSTPSLNTVGVFPGFSPYRDLSPPMPPDIASPFMPNLGPPTLSSSQAAMDAVLASERKRMKEKELEEQNMSVEEIKAVLKRERIRMSRMAADLASLKSNLVQNQAEAEVNEEGRINCLLAHLDGLQQEKGRIIVELEREEEMVSSDKYTQFTRRVTVHSQSI